jgi:hypothetical protein
VIAIALTGDPIAGTWSIGAGFSPGIPILDGLLTNPEGISYSHNEYESDASIVRVSCQCLSIQEPLFLISNEHSDNSILERRLFEQWRCLFG